MLTIFTGIRTLFTWSFCLQSYEHTGTQITVAHFHMRFIHIGNFAFLCKTETRINVYTILRENEFIRKPGK